MWSLNHDGEMDPRLEPNRDARMHIDLQQKRRECRDLVEDAHPQHGVDGLKEAFPQAKESRWVLSMSTVQIPKSMRAGPNIELDVELLLGSYTQERYSRCKKWPDDESHLLAEPEGGTGGAVVSREP